MDLIEAFAQVSDFRRPQGKRHSLPCVFVCMFVGSLSGCISWRDHGDFVTRHSHALLKYLRPGKDRLPSYSTLRRVFEGIDFDALSAAFLTWARQRVRIEPDEWLAIDGKSLRGTVSDATDAQQNFIALVTLYAHKRGIAFESRAYENKQQSEVHVVEAMLAEATDLHGAGVTLDSLHCRKKEKTCGLIREAGAHYLVGLKANQPKLLAAAEELAATAAPESTWEDEERTRDRHTRRKASVYRVPEREPFSAWPDLKCVVWVERSGTRGSEPYAERSFYISSLLSTAQELGEVIREHWQIENGLHWVKDVVLKEDGCRTRAGEAAQNLALLRTMAVSVFRMHGYRSIKRALRRFAHDIGALLRLLE